MKRVFKQGRESFIDCFNVDVKLISLGTGTNDYVRFVNRKLSIRSPMVVCILVGSGPIGISVSHPVFSTDSWHADGTKPHVLNTMLTVQYMLINIIDLGFSLGLRIFGHGDINDKNSSHSCEIQHIIGVLTATMKKYETGGARV